MEKRRGERLACLGESILGPLFSLANAMFLAGQLPTYILKSVIPALFYRYMSPSCHMTYHFRYLRQCHSFSWKSDYCTLELHPSLQLYHIQSTN